MLAPLFEEVEDLLLEASDGRRVDGTVQGGDDGCLSVREDFRPILEV